MIKIIKLIFVSLLFMTLPLCAVISLPEIWIITEVFFPMLPFSLMVSVILLSAFIGFFIQFYYLYVKLADYTITVKKIVYPLIMYTWWSLILAGILRILLIGIVIIPSFIYLINPSYNFLIKEDLFWAFLTFVAFVITNTLVDIVLIKGYFRQLPIFKISKETLIANILSTAVQMLIVVSFRYFYGAGEALSTVTFRG